MSAGLNVSGIIDTIRQKAYEAARERIQEIAQTITNVMHREFRNDLIFSGLSRYQNEFTNVQAQVEQESDTSFKIVLNLEGMSARAKELVLFYFNNAKALAVGT